MQRGSMDGQWIQSPRLRQCFNNIQLGAKMGRELTGNTFRSHGSQLFSLFSSTAGASVGGCFGLLTGAWVAITQRNLLVPENGG